MKLRPQTGLVGNTSQVIQAMAGGSFDLAIAGEWVQAGMYDDGLPLRRLFHRKAGDLGSGCLCFCKDTKQS